MTDKNIMPKNLQFYGEWVEYQNEDERELAKIYLNLWKHFILKKFPDNLKLLDEQLIERENIQISGVKSPCKTMGIKLSMQKLEEI